MPFRVLAALPLPFTFRRSRDDSTPAWEGGEWRGDTEERSRIREIKLRLYLGGESRGGICVKIEVSRLAWCTLVSVSLARLETVAVKRS